MAKNNIYFFETEQWEKEKILALLPKKYTAKFISQTLTEKNVRKFRDATVISIFIYSAISEKVLAQLPNLRMIATRSTGVDHIDLATCRKRKIKVLNVPNYGENTVAEHAFALLLAVTRRITQAHDKVRKLDFDIHGLRGFDLQGRTLGIVGTGRIGQHLARMAKGFSMKVVAFDVQRDQKLARKLGFTYVKDLRTLMGVSDVVSLHVPELPATHHMINQKNVRWFKRGAVLINTARGGLVETQALLTALDEKILSGAGLDVLEEECNIREEAELLSQHLPQACNPMTVLANHVLIERPNVIVTPHIAFNSNEAVERILHTTVKNIIGYIER